MMDRQVFSGDVSVQTFGTLRRKVFAKKIKNKASCNIFCSADFAGQHECGALRRPFQAMIIRNEREQSKSRYVMLCELPGCFPFLS